MNAGGSALGGSALGGSGAARAKSPVMLQNYIIFSITLFLLIAVLGSAAFFFSMRHIITSNKSGELTKLLELERVKLESSISKEIAIVLKMANSPLIRRYFENPADPEIKRMADEEIGAYRRVLSGPVFWVSDIDKLFYYNDQEPHPLDTKAPENYWYPMTLKGIDIYNLNINYNAKMNETNLWINAPVFNYRHAPVGMIGTGIDLSAFITAIYAVYDSPRGRAKTHFYLFNDAEEITGAADVRLVAEKANIRERLGGIGAYTVDAAKNLKPGEVQSFSSSAGQVAVISIPTLEWYAVAVLPDSIGDFYTPMTVFFLLVILVIAFILILSNIFIARLITPLRETMARLESASKAKSDFLAKMSHEIRTPMNAIMGMSELALREENMPQAAYSHVMTINNAGANLLAIINDILDISKIESGRLEIVPDDYLFPSLINDVISIIRMRVIDSSVRFVANIDCNIPRELYGDVIRVRQVLLNLLSNAVKYTGSGYVELKIVGEKVDQNTILLNIDVKDTGKGIKEEDIGKLFGDFVQVDREKNKGIEGTGLGLAIVKNIVKMMGGDVGVVSEYGKGSTFSVMLPQAFTNPRKMAAVEEPERKSVLIYERRDIYANSVIYTLDNLGVKCAAAKDDAEFREKMAKEHFPFVFASPFFIKSVRNICAELNQKARVIQLTAFGETVSNKDVNVLAMPVYPTSVADLLNGAASRYGASQESAKRFTAPDASVLIVDDINTNLKVAEGLMTPYKMRIDLRKSGPDAIDAVKSKRYDIVFMDHMMPGMDGIEATKRIRELPGEEYRNLPIVALTANAVSGVREMYMNEGFNDFLSKPIETVKLGAILERWIPKEKQQNYKENASEKSVLGNDTGNAGGAGNGDSDIRISGVDTKRGISMTGGAENYLRTLAIFREDARTKLGEIKIAREKSDLPLYAIYVHAIKSAAANIGAAGISEAAKNLEAAAKREDKTFIDENTDALMTDLETLIAGIAAAIGADKDHQEADEADPDALKAALTELKNALDAMNAKEIDKITEKMQEFANAAKIGAAVENIIQNVFIGDYDEAETLIENLMKNIAP